LLKCPRAWQGLLENSPPLMRISSQRAIAWTRVDARIDEPQKDPKDPMLRSSGAGEDRKNVHGQQPVQCSLETVPVGEFGTRNLNDTAASLGIASSKGALGPLPTFEPT
jgi:hypothetical protein